MKCLESRLGWVAEVSVTRRLLMRQHDERIQDKIPLNIIPPDIIPGQIPIVGQNPLIYRIQKLSM